MRKHLYTKYYGALWSSILFRCMQPHVYLYLFAFSRIEVFPQFHPIPSSKMLTFYRKEPFTLSAVYTKPALIPFPKPEIGQWHFLFLQSAKQAWHSIHLQHHWSNTVESLSLRPPQKMVLEELFFDQGFICAETGMERFHKRSLKGGGLASWLSLYPYSA